MKYCSKGKEDIHSLGFSSGTGAMRVVKFMR